MPVNKRGLRYELYDSPSKDKEGRNILCAKLVSNGTINQKAMEEYLEENASIHPADARRVLTAFANAVAHLLANGYRIDTILGSLYPKLSLDAPYTRDDKVTATQVGLEGVGFLPDKAFVETVRANVRGFRREHVHPAQPISSRDEIERKVRKLATYNDGLFNQKQFQDAFGLSEYMARKQLNELCQSDHPMLTKRKIGKIYLYQINE